MASTVTLRFVGDDRDLQRSFKSVQGAAGQTQSVMGRMSGVIKTAAAGAAGALAVSFGRDSVNAFKEAQAAQAQLEQAFAKFPALAGTNIESLRNLNSELAKKTRFDDDATASGQAVLAGFNLTGNQIKQLTPLLQDYAAKTGKDLPTAAQDLGKAVLGQGRALKNIGANFKDTGSAAGNFAELTDVLNAKVGGFATREGKTAAGQAAIMKNQFGELQEKVGSALVPALTKLADVGLKIINFFQNLPGPAQAAIGVVGGLIVVALGIAKAMQAWTAIQAAFNVVMAANPVVLVAVAIAALGAAVVLAYQHFQPFHDAVDKAWQLLQSGFHWIQDNWPLLLAILTGPFGLAVKFIVDHFDSIVGFVKGLPGKIASAASGMWDGIKTAFKAAVNFIIDGWNRIEFKIPGFKVGPIGFGGFTLGLPDIPRLAEGGIVTRPTLALIGEAGAEAVVPLGRNRGVGNNYTIQVNAGIGADTASIETAVVDAIQRYERRNGKGWRDA